MIASECECKCELYTPGENTFACMLESVLVLVLEECRKNDKNEVHDGYPHKAWPDMNKRIFILLDSLEGALQEINSNIVFLYSL